MQFNEALFDKEYAESICSNHPFSPDSSEMLPGNDAYSACFLLWLHEISNIPSVHLEQITHLLLLWKSVHTKTWPTFQDLSNKINIEWNSIILSPRKHINPALCSLVLKQINSNYMDINLKTLASELDLNSSYLSRVISRDFKCGFPDLLQTKRLLLSIKAMSTPSDQSSLDSIAADLGYSSPHYFYCVFKKYTGLSPSIARNMFRLIN